jgi:hypothetical protein
MELEKGSIMGAGCSIRFAGVIGAPVDTFVLYCTHDTYTHNSGFRIIATEK